MARMGTLSRRDVLAASAAGLLLPRFSWSSPGVPDPARKRVARFAHLTDIHVQPERGAGVGMERAFVHAQSQKDKPDFIITGGDLIMDSLGGSPERVQAQWNLFKSVLAANCKVPVHHTIGNHDVRGWADRKTYGSETKFGKTWVKEELELKSTYYSFDYGKWHFVILDSIHAVPDGADGYMGRLDDEQFEWLADDLKKTPTTQHVMVVSHMPIISACAIMSGSEKTGSWVVSPGLMHIDARRIRTLFAKYPNVKLCLSGHEHLLDLVTLSGVSYLCQGAVCGGWWLGDHEDCTYGYAMVELYDDGSFESKYIPYGWKTQK